jgi:plasmid stability protein
MKMAELIVRNIEEELVYELTLRAARNGQTAEEEHRQILRRALAPPRFSSSLKEHLEQMPDVGTDEDFARSRDLGRPVTL